MLLFVVVVVVVVVVRDDVVNVEFANTVANTEAEMQTQMSA